MKKLIAVFLSIVLLVSVLTACASGSRPQTATVPMPAPSFPGGMPPDMATSDGGKGEATVTVQYQGLSDRMIIRTGNLSLVVDDVAGAVTRITELTDSFQGYVVSSNTWKEGERLMGVITVRVPVDRFTTAIHAFRDLAVEVNSESTGSTDVTEEYVDLEAKLRNLEAAEAQLLRLMERAEKVEDILAIQKELTQVRGEIEQTRGRMQYLERTSETSLVEIYLQQSKLDVKFTASSSRLEKGQVVWFFDQIAGGFSPYSYEWDFGDGNTSTQQNPNHAYRSPGTYTVSLTVTDDRGNSDEEVREDYITVLPGWNAGSVAGSAWDGLVTLGQTLANVLIWIGIFSPVWIIAGLVALWAWRRSKKRAGQ